MAEYEAPLAVFTQNSNQGVKAPWMMVDDSTWEPVVHFSYAFPNTKNVVFWGEYSPDGGPIMMVDLLEQILLFKQYSFERNIPRLQLEHYAKPVAPVCSLLPFKGFPLASNPPSVTAAQITGKVFTLGRPGFIPIPRYPKYTSVPRDLTEDMFDLTCNKTNWPKFYFDWSVIRDNFAHMEKAPGKFDKSYNFPQESDSETELRSIPGSTEDGEGDGSRPPGIPSESLDSTQKGSTDQLGGTGIPETEQFHENVPEENRIGRLRHQSFSESTDSTQKTGTGAPPTAVPSLSSVSGASIHTQSTQSSFDRELAAVVSSLSRTSLLEEGMAPRDVTMAELSAQCGSSVCLVPPAPVELEDPAQPASTQAKKAKKNQKKKFKQPTPKQVLKAKRKEEKEQLEREVQRQVLAKSQFEVVELKVYIYLDFQRFYRDKTSVEEVDESEAPETEKKVPVYSIPKDQDFAEIEKKLLVHSNTKDQEFFSNAQEDCFKFLEERVRHYTSIDADLDTMVLRAMLGDKSQTVIEDWTYLESVSWKTDVDYAQVEKSYLDVVKTRGRIPENQMELPVTIHDHRLDTRKHQELYDLMEVNVKRYVGRQQLLRGFAPEHDKNPTYARIERLLLNGWRGNSDWFPGKADRALQKRLYLEWQDVYFNGFQKAQSQETYNVMKVLARGLSFLSLNDAKLLVFDSHAIKQYHDYEASDISFTTYLTEVFRGQKSQAIFE